tara:strand:+ start:394 stop:630 length:237 start_codon:yes stop_codon:yes gene_type:complete
MCLGGGGGYAPPPAPPKPVYEAGPESPPDMVNDQIIPNANSRENQEAARNNMDPTKGIKKLNNKTKLQVQSDKNPGMM